MCCDATETLNLPADVIEALAHYRRLLGDHGADWGENSEMFGLAGFSLIGPTVAALMATGDLSQAIRTALGDVPVQGRAAAIAMVDVDGSAPVVTVEVQGETLRIEDAVRPSAAAELRLTTGRCARWSVTDAGGGAWFPDGCCRNGMFTTGRSSTPTTAPSRCPPSR